MALTTVAVLLVGVVVAVQTFAMSDNVALGDLAMYQDATRRLFAGEGWYLPEQLAGPYPFWINPVLYPPVAAWFFAPWLVLPAWTFVAIPVAIVAWFVASCRPAPWTWPLLALLVAWPLTYLHVFTANPGLWICAFIALGLRYQWPAALVLLKPSLAPFALIGIRSRGWWVTVGLLGLASLPFLTETLTYPAVVLRMTDGGALYSVLSLPMMLIPITAWAGRR